MNHQKPISRHTDHFQLYDAVTQILKTLKLLSILAISETWRVVGFGHVALECAVQ